MLPRHPGQTSPLASDHHGLLIIPIHWLASSLCLLSTNKLVCDGRSGALWLPSHHPGGCCTLVVDEEIAPLLCKALWVSRKALYKCNKLLWLLLLIVLALILLLLPISLSARVTHWVSCWWRWGMCPCVLFMCKCMMYLMSHPWLRFCLYGHMVNVYMSEWFVYSLSKDQFPLCVWITAAEYFHRWNFLSEHLRELLNVLFTQH